MKNKIKNIHDRKPALKNYSTLFKSYFMKIILLLIANNLSIILSKVLIFKIDQQLVDKNDTTKLLTGQFQQLGMKDHIHQL